MSQSSRPDRDALFEDLIREMGAPMNRAATVLLKDPSMAKDVAQEALLRTYTHWSRAQSNPKAYAWVTLINLCRDQQRRRFRRPQEVTEISELPDGASQLSMADRIVNRLELERALGLLPRQQREVIVLRYLIGMSVKEAAHVLEIPEGTIKSATNRALAALRNTLEDIYQEVHIHVD